MINYYTTNLLPCPTSLQFNVIFYAKPFKCLDFLENQTQVKAKVKDFYYISKF